MGAFDCITEESYKLIRDLHRKGVIKEKLYRNLEDAEQREEIENIFSSSFCMNKKKAELIWHYLRSKVWKWERASNENTVFNEYQNVFVEKILSHGGVYSRFKCQKELLTNQQIKNHVTDLEEMEVVYSIRTKRSFGNRTFFFLNPLIVNEAEERIEELCIIEK